MTEEVRVSGSGQSSVRVLVPAIPLAVGGFVGYQGAYLSTTGQSLAGLNLIAGMALVGLLAFVCVLVAIGSLLRPRGSGRRAARLGFGAAGLLLLGWISGTVAVSALDLGYQQPRSARGTAAVSLSNVSGFSSRLSGPADCSSVANGNAVGGVVALDLGDVGSDRLRAEIRLPATPDGAPQVALWIFERDPPPNTELASWSGEGSEFDSAADGMSGSLQFSATRSTMRTPPRGWPTVLEGELSWTCEPWLDPNAAPPAVVIATLSMSLVCADWSAPAEGAMPATAVLP